MGWTIESVDRLDETGRGSCVVGEGEEGDEGGGVSEGVIMRGEGELEVGRGCCISGGDGGGGGGG